MPTWGELLQELQQVGAAGQIPPGLSKFDLVRRKYIAALAAHTNRSTILYASAWTAGNAPPEMISINPEDMEGFMEVVHGLPGPRLDLVLHSPGGSAEATEALVSYLRSKFSDVRVLIPHAAMSAATMLACSANRIVLGKHSFIGPIDPQFILQTDLGVRAVPAHAIVEQFRLAQEECVKDSARLSSWIPMLRQYGPALLVQCRLAQKLSEELVSGWLEHYMLAGTSEAPTKAARIAAALCDHGQFKSHSRFISRDAAKQMGLSIEDLESDQTLQDLTLSVFHATSHTFVGTPAVKVIENHFGKAFIKIAQVTVVPERQAPPPQGLRRQP